MPAQKNKLININLLPKDALNDTSIGRFLNWALSTGRYIVIFTEMIVILTFLSRFTLDRQLADLNESILKKQAVMESYANIEQRVRNIQKKGEFITTINQGIKPIELLDFLADKAPENIIFDQLDIKDDRFILIATAYSQDSLTVFIKALRNENQRFSDVILDKITTTDNTSGISFTIRANYITNPN